MDMVAGAPSVAEIQGYANNAANNNGLDPAVFLGLIQTESSFNPFATSKVGAQGLGQLMPGTAKQYGVTDPYNWQQNINASAEYLSHLIGQFGSVSKGLAAYNIGPGNEANGKFQGSATDYVNTVMSHAGNFGGVGGVNDSSGSTLLGKFRAKVEAPILQAAGVPSGAVPFLLGGISAKRLAIVILALILLAAAIFNLTGARKVIAVARTALA